MSDRCFYSPSVFGVQGKYSDPGHVKLEGGAISTSSEVVLYVEITLKRPDGRSLWLATC